MAVLAFLPTQTTYIEPEIPVVQPVATTTEVAIVDEVKDPEVTFSGVACNCYAKVRSLVPHLPPMASINPNAEPVVGAVAVEYFNGIKHVSLVTSVTDTGVNVIESNYHHCKEGNRFIPFDKHSLVGFWVAG